MKADISQAEDIDRSFDEAHATFGKLHITVSNAGVELIGISAPKFTEKQFVKLLAVKNA